MRLFIGSAILIVASALVGCNALVDSAPSQQKPVLNIEEYYLPLKSIGTSYAYCRKNSTGADTIWMTMQGNDASGLMMGNQACYSADMTKMNLYLNNFYYAMNDSEAYTLGKVSCGNNEKYWLDLKAPLMVGQQWKFNNSNGSYYIQSRYTAEVTRRGVQMKMPDGKTYDDVAEVVYTSQSGDSTVKWFARGVGLIYSTSKQPDSDFGEEMRLVGQK
ncbi:MAG: hypothetical protein Q8916_07000 [Bacteroidota bacterium]|nr:hypothetical protein [Bacteroidota bacterium]MDP4230138.1 hypothetical protein [Bacteroidota bacterium]MDP4235491.1 hypothetical protein [Bacteroidota bacterium]